MVKSKSPKVSSASEFAGSVDLQTPTVLSKRWFEEALDKALDILNLKHGNLRLLNSDTGSLDLMAARGFPPGYEKKFRTIKTDERSAGKVVQAQGPVLWDNIQRDSAYAYVYLRREGIDSLLGVPLMGREGIVGTLVVGSPDKNAFGAEEAKLLASMAKVVGVAIENSNLFTALKRNVDELRNLNRQLKEANEIKHRLLGIISHEMRTPMSVILGNLGFLVDGTLGGINERQRGSLKTVRRSATNLLFQIENALEVVELDAGGVVIHPFPFSIEHVREAMMELFEDEIERKNLKMHWEIDPNAPQLFADRRMITKVFRNLIDNAIKFTEKGSVTVRVSFSQERKRLECMVEDTGIGIPPNQFKVIFDPFHQVDSSYTRFYGGMGLGLCNVQRTLEFLGGGIEAESTVGKGSIFRFWFPMEHEQQE